MPYVHSVQTALAPHYYDQEDLIEAVVDQVRQRYFNVDRIVSFQRNVLVNGRNLALPLARYKDLDGLAAQNDAWLEVALPMAEQAVVGVLNRAGLRPQDISLITSTTVTGLAVPSIEARLMNRLPFRRHTKRMPLFGLGCAAGAAGVNIVADYLKGHPDEAAILLSIELCSLTVQRRDLSVANIIASGLFGDGGAAVLMVGDRHPLAQSAPLRWLASRTTFFPDTERALGWDIVDSGLKIVLASNLSELVSDSLPDELESFLDDEGLSDKPPSFFIAHPGGPRILEATAAALGLEREALEHSWSCLTRYGNMSSAAVLFVLAELLANPPDRGEIGTMFAFGPGFSADIGLFRSTASPNRPKRRAQPLRAAPSPHA